jgi:Flp pilus assembly secretin CpaC
VTNATVRSAGMAVLVVATLAAGLWSQGARAATEVLLDQAKVIRLPAGMATIVIGNPAIADITVQKSGVAILTGKAYGTTNIIILDAHGETILNEPVVVKAPEEDIVTVQRGPDRESLACTPLCERTVKMGDAQANFDAATNQASTRTGLATK